MGGDGRWRDGGADNSTLIVFGTKNSLGPVVLVCGERIHSRLRFKFAFLYHLVA